jgi:hypothetical protein
LSLPSPLPALLLLSAAVLLLLPVQRYLFRHLQGLLLIISRRQSVALYLYALLFFPGVVLHEGSHWLIARLLGVGTRRVSLLPSRQRGGRMRFGYVETEVSDPLRASLIGVAPLVAGTVVCLVVAAEILGLGPAGERLVAADGYGALQAAIASLNRPDALVWLYLCFAISNTMLPSASDRQAWLWPIGGLAALAAGLYLAGLAPGAANWLAPWVEAASLRLTAVMGLTVVLDAVLLPPVLLTEALVARLVGVRIEY